MARYPFVPQQRADHKPARASYHYGYVGARSRNLSALALLAGAVIAISAHPAQADAETLCQRGVVHDYEKSLKRLPSLRSAPSSEHLPFAPRNLFFYRVGHGPLLMGGGEVGYSLYLESARHPGGQAAGWLVTAKLAEVDHQGRNVAKSRWRRLRIANSPFSQRLAFRVSREPALYRLEIVFRNRSGKKLARYGEYFRVLESEIDANLVLPTTVFRPGELVVPRLVNRGTEPLFYGLHYTIESFDGTQWVTAKITPTGPVLAIGISSGPGEWASCWQFRIPPDAAPGLYRFVWSGSAGRNGRLNGRNPFTLSAEFEIPSAS